MWGRTHALGLGILLLSIGAVPVQGQITLTGLVLDDSTGRPLSGAHVFVPRSMSGTTTDSTGQYRLEGLPPGAIRLFASHVGYEPLRRSHVVSHDTTLTDTLRLQPTVVQAGSLTVEAERDDEWAEHRRRFERLFIGEGPWAHECVLQNPEVLRFDTAWWGKFEVSARRPLHFVNRRLGYRVRYHLTEFEQVGDRVRWDGEPYFEPLTPRDSAEARRWARNRRRAFHGSLQHFLLALLHDSVSEEQFRMHRLRRDPFRGGDPDRVPVNRDDLLHPSPDTTVELSFFDRLEVIYDGEPEAPAYLDWIGARRAPRSHQRSVIELNERPIHIDPQGEIVEPYGATLYRYFSYSARLAQMLPRTYRPPDWPPSGE